MKKMVITKEKLKEQMVDLRVSLENYKRENKKLNKKIKYIKNTLFNFRQSCYDEMVVINSEGNKFSSYLVLTNDTFNKLFERLIRKFRKFPSTKFRKEVESEINI